MAHRYTSRMASLSLALGGGLGMGCKPPIQSDPSLAWGYVESIEIESAEHGCIEAFQSWSGDRASRRGQSHVPVFLELSGAIVKGIGPSCQ